MSRKKNEIKVAPITKSKQPKSSSVFDPEGSGYDYETAKKHGITADKTGHWPSRSIKSGQLLKGRKHKTYHKTIKGEEAAGYEIYKGQSGRYYSKPKKKQVDH